MKWLTIFCIGLFSLAAIFIYCEYGVYGITLKKCSWPELKNFTGNNRIVLKTIILADTHLLGPHHGHWFDKLRREWQMYVSFQTAVKLFRPEVIFILGDVFDEGHFVNHEDFNNYLIRYRELFYTPKDIRVISVVGNHDVGFHYRMHPFFVDRFQEAFGNTGVTLHTIKNVHFVTINSMAMENDRCYFCETAINQLKKTSEILNCAKDPDGCRDKTALKGKRPYSRPIIMQHFPTYRLSDESCVDYDMPELENYRENWEVLSRESTLLIGDLLKPRLAFSGHTHHFCYTKNILDIEEFTLPSFNWRNKNNPSFFLAKFTPAQHSVNVCYMPEESHVLGVYTAAGVIYLTVVVLLLLQKKCLNF